MELDPHHPLPIPTKREVCTLTKITDQPSVRLTPVTLLDSDGSKSTEANARPPIEATCGTEAIRPIKHSRNEYSDVDVKRVEIPAPIDKTQRLAAQCAEYTTRYVKSSPSHYRTPTFPTPTTALEPFIHALLTTSDAPLLTTVYGTLALMGWLAEAGACRKASSSPHHFFLAAFVVMSNMTWNTAWDDAPWVARTHGLVSSDVVRTIRREVEDALDVDARSPWDVLDGIINSELKKPTVFAERTHEVIHFDPTCSAYCETVVTRYTTGKTTTAVKICYFYKLKMLDITALSGHASLGCLNINANEFGVAHAGGPPIPARLRSGRDRVIHLNAVFSIVVPPSPSKSSPTIKTLPHSVTTWRPIVHLSVNSAITENAPRSLGFDLTVYMSALVGHDLDDYTVGIEGLCLAVSAVEGGVGVRGRCCQGWTGYTSTSEHGVQPSSFQVGPSKRHPAQVCTPVRRRPALKPLLPFLMPAYVLCFPYLMTATLAPALVTSKQKSRARFNGSKSTEADYQTPVGAWNQSSKQTTAGTPDSNDRWKMPQMRTKFPDIERAPSSAGQVRPPVQGAGRGQNALRSTTTARNMFRSPEYWREESTSSGKSHFEPRDSTLTNSRREESRLYAHVDEIQLLAAKCAEYTARYD
ncbi:hypothetical protein EYR38_002444 [Pleurotus pulmonarius]|nr:hypothetical protein EYR38_002444 [Pleurotus pulmonarius]